MLVLIAMQKIASSSVAAIRRALRKRLQRVEDGRQRAKDLEQKLKEYRELDEAAENDRVSALEEELVGLSASLRLMEDEEPRLRELVAAADRVTSETKIDTILAILDGPFAGREGNCHYVRVQVVPTTGKAPLPDCGGSPTSQIAPLHDQDLVALFLGN